MKNVINSIEEFSTSRLFARKLTEDDFDLILPLYQNEFVMETLGGVIAEDIVREKFRWNLERWKLNGFGQWLWFEKATNHFMGRGGLREMEIEGKQVIEVGYVLLPEFWGQGFATEIAIASVKIAFEILDIKELVCFTLATHLKSKHVMEKVGFKFDHEFIYEGQPHVLYYLTKELLK